MKTGVWSKACDKNYMVFFFISITKVCVLFIIKAPTFHSTVWSKYTFIYFYLNQTGIDERNYMGSVYFFSSPSLICMVVFQGYVSICHHLASVCRTPQAFTFKYSPLKPLNQFTANLAGMVLCWVPFKFVSDSPVLHSKMAAVTKNW
jgi:hypothetical protein